MTRLWRVLINMLLFPVFGILTVPDDGGSDGDPSPEQRALEELNVKIKSIGDSLGDIPTTVKEEVERRVQEITGDATAHYEEMEEKLTASEERLTAAIQEQRAPAAVADGTREEDYGYGNEAGGFDEMVAEVRACGAGGMGTPERLLKMHKGEIERRGLSTLTGVGGGYWMRPQFSNELLQIPPDQQWLSSMIRMLPKTDPPNAEFTYNAFDQSGSKGVFGGVVVYSAKELADLTETSYPSIMQVTFKPEKVGAFWTVSEESQANTPQMGSMMQPLINGAVLAQRDDKIQTGTGAGELKGFASSPAMITVARSVDDEINYIDLLNMLARVMSNGGGRFVWVCQRVGIIQQLGTLADGAGQLIWSSDARSALPTATLMGIPIFFNEISPALGTQGDLRLLNLDYYMVKPGMGATLKSDMGILNFLKDQETLKISYYEDGKPWITSALTLRNGTNTVSPFVELTDA